MTTMTTIIATALILLGLAIGFVVAWAFGAGTSLSLLTGLLLVVTGAIIGFVVEWFIDEAYRRNRELQRQLSQQESGPARIVVTDSSAQNDAATSQALADFLHQREEEVRQLRQQIAATDAQMNALREKFEAYQRTHPDDLTVIKGIGPVFQRKLRDIGFNSFEQLVKADPDRLRRMLDIKSWQRADVEFWIEQARDWVERSM